MREETRTVDSARFCAEMSGIAAARIMRGAYLPGLAYSDVRNHADAAYDHARQAARAAAVVILRSTR